MIDELITEITSAVTTRSLYPAQHPRVLDAVMQIVDRLNRKEVTFLIVGEDLVIDEKIVRQGTLTQRQFVNVLKRRGIERLTLAPGVTVEELQAFVAALATSTQPEGSDHIIIGRVEVAVEGEESEAGDRHALNAENLDLMREAFVRFRAKRRLPFGEMEQMVWAFIDAMSKTTRAVLPLAKLKEHDEYTFVHSINVSLLVLAQARSFGMEGSLLHAFGMAGLLHDIGKLMVPLEILNKPGKLEGDAWEIMRSHAEQGSWYLAEMDGAAPLTVVVAYEHHLRYDGQPAYPILRVPRVPSLASRMTSIADAYDAMSTVRPYQKPLMRKSALDILRTRAETFYDPVLVSNFADLIGPSI